MKNKVKAGDAVGYVTEGGEVEARVLAINPDGTLCLSYEAGDLRDRQKVMVHRANEGTDVGCCVLPAGPAAPPPSSADCLESLVDDDEEGEW